MNTPKNSDLLLKFVDKLQASIKDGFVQVIQNLNLESEADESWSNADLYTSIVAACLFQARAFAHKFGMPEKLFAERLRDYADRIANGDFKSDQH
jgi:hypothetical protein